MLMQLAGMEPKKAEACMSLFAKEVIPHFRKINTEMGGVALEN